MNPRPLVSVIMNCLNGAEYLRPALDSVFAQTYANWEIIFWDNHSSDNSGEIARSYGERVRYFLGDSVVPLSAGRRFASERACGRYFAILDTDDIWAPEYLERMMALLESNPGCAIAWSDAWQIRADGLPLRRYSQFTRIYRGRCFEELLREQFISPSSAMVFRAEAVRAVGGWSLNNTCLAEAELLLRLTLKYEVEYCQDALVQWRLHGTNTLGTGQSIKVLSEWKPILLQWKSRPEGKIVSLAAFRENILRIYLKMALEAANAIQPWNMIIAMVSIIGILLRHPSLWVILFRQTRRYSWIKRTLMLEDAHKPKL